MDSLKSNIFLPHQNHRNTAPHPVKMRVLSAFVHSLRNTYLHLYTIANIFSNASPVRLNVPFNSYENITLFEDNLNGRIKNMTY